MDASNVPGDSDLPTCPPRTWCVALLLTLAILPFLVGLNQFYYIDDGLSLLLGKRAAEQGWSNAFGFGFNGHFRPLPQLTWAVVYSAFGADSPVPYHAAALPLHALDTLLVWILLRKLLRPGQAFLALGAAALFAVHWFATEAVTYVSAVGVVWSLAGGLIACLGALTWKDGAPSRGCAGLVVGVLIALGGGEYGVACLPLIVACAFWPRSREAGRRRGRALAISGTAGCLFAAYIVFETLCANRGRLGSHFRPGAHMAGHLKDNVARIAFPSPWLGMDACFVLVALAAVAALCCRPIRDRLADLPALGLLLGGVGALLPFAPSRAGNYGRFLYIATPFLSCLLLLLLAACAAPF